MTRLVATVCLLASASVASADAIAIPSEPCPSGTHRQIAGHGGTWCESIGCDGCGGTCPEVALCQGPGTHYVEHGHLATSPPPTPQTHTEVYGPCGFGGTCERGTCVTERRCVAEARSPSPPSPSPAASSCRVGAASASFGLSMVAFSALLYARSTRRRAQRRWDRAVRHPTCSVTRRAGRTCPGARRVGAPPRG